MALLTELRTGIEPSRRGWPRSAAPKQAGQLITLARYMVDTFLVHDIAFHQLVLTASGNAMFAQLGDPIAEVLRGQTYDDLMPRSQTPKPSACT